MHQLQIQTHQYALNIIKFLRTLPRSYIAETIGKQLIRCATSIGANIIEAQAASSRKDFINFYHIAFKSANECRFWIELLRDAQISPLARVDVLLQETNAITKMLGASLLTLKGKRKNHQVPSS